MGAGAQPAGNDPEMNKSEYQYFRTIASGGDATISKVTRS